MSELKVSEERGALAVGEPPGLGWTVVLRRQPTRIVDGQPQGGYMDLYELVCCDCGDSPDRDYRDVSPKLQRIRGPYPIAAGITAYQQHARRHRRRVTRPRESPAPVLQGRRLAMFVQVIQGLVNDPGQVRDALDLWDEQLAMGAVGWLGSTAGVTEDGRFVALARFESEQSAQLNSDRPEQHQWWMETAKLFRGEVTFRDSTAVTVDVQGDPDAAGFVQVMRGRSNDPERAWDLVAQNPDEWAAFRPEVLGSVTVGHEGGGYTMALYFTSEQAAREGERKEPPPRLKAQMAEMDKLSVGEPEFFDLRQPWLYSP